MRIFDETLSRVERSLDLHLQRQEVLSGNIANVDTPGFRPKDIDFGAAMSSALDNGGPVSRTDAHHFDSEGGAIGMGIGGDAAGDGHAPAPVIEAGGTTPSMDGNQVDLDRTMAAMAENGMQYGASARAASKKLAILRYVASDGVG